MATKEKMLAIARSQLGYTEGSGNRTKYGKWYGVPASPWCDMFVSWCAAQAGATSIVGKFSYTPSHAAWFKKKGRWGHTPKPGALVFFNWPDGVNRIQHVEIVEAVRADGRIVTIGGNVGNQVKRCVRSTKYVAGYGYPAYATPPRPPAAKPPVKKPTTKPKPPVKKPEPPKHVYARVNVRSVLRLRKKASTFSAVIDRMADNTKVEVLEKGKTWTKVKHDGKVGYAATKYLRF
jgi:hypothetical protein